MRHTTRMLTVKQLQGTSLSTTVAAQGSLWAKHDALDWRLDSLALHAPAACPHPALYEAHATQHGTSVQQGANICSTLARAAAAAAATTTTEAAAATTAATA